MHYALNLKKLVEKELDRLPKKIHVQILTQSTQETHEVGLRLARHLTAGTVVGLEGPLGAGKTTLIQGICKGLGVREKVVSPTFVLMHVYQGKIPVYHFDLYRLERKELEDLGWDEYLEGKGVSLIEWVDRAKGEFPFPHLRILIEYGDMPDSRKFTFEPVKALSPWLGEFLRFDENSRP